MTRAYDPPHPGEELRDGVLPAMGWSVSKAAETIGISERVLRGILDGKRGISPRTARRLAETVGFSARLWLALQEDYDAWHAQNPMPPSRRELAEAKPTRGTPPQRSAAEGRRRVAAA